MSTTIACIGYGYWGPNLARNVHQHPSASLALVADASEERRRKVVEQLPGVPVAADLANALDDPAIDAVVIALPAAMHYHATKAALLADKHVLVEKPLALHTTEARELRALARQRGKVLMVGHTFLYNAAVNHVRSYITDGVLGDIHYVSMQRLNLGRVRSDIDVIWNLAPHDVSILLHWFGEAPQQVAAQGFAHLQPGITDVAFLTLRFSGDRLGQIHVSWLDPNKVRAATVVGTKKMVVYDDVSADRKVQLFDKGIDKQNLGDDLGSYDNFGRFQLIQRAGDLLIPKLTFAEPLRAEIADFVDAIETGKRPLADAEGGVLVTRVLEAAGESLAQGGGPVQV